jgi:hypothetical protein
MKKKIQIAGLLFYLTIISGCNGKQGQTENINLTCDLTLNEFQFVHLDRVDLSKLLSVVEYNNDLFLSVFLNGTIYMYDASENETIAISRPGKGPFEFTNPVLYVYNDVLFAYDMEQLKIAEYDLHKNKFIKEYSLTQYIGGPLIYISSINEHQVFYFKSIKRNRIESNDTFVNVISFEPFTDKYDTIYSFVDYSRLNYWDQSRKADFSLDAPMYTHTKIGVLAGHLATAETNKFSFKFIENNRLSIELNYNYKPNYDAYLNGLFAQIDERSSSPEYRKRVFKEAIDNRSESFGSKFYKWISSKKYSLFSLFSTKNAHLLIKVNNKEGKVICTDSTYKPVLIDDDGIYWLAETNEYEPELLRTKIETIENE